MDPALGITSPFRNEAKATDGVLDGAIQVITASEDAEEWNAKPGVSSVHDAWSIHAAAHRDTGMTHSSAHGPHAAHATETIDNHPVQSHDSAEGGGCAAPYGDYDDDAARGRGACANVEEDGSDEYMPESHTACMICGANSTAVTVPADGFYICPDCNIQRRCEDHKPVYPQSTFKCCPDSTDEGNSGVVRCYACGEWYHCGCMGITHAAVRQHVSLSTTQWYCPEPACCEGHLAAQLSKRGQ